MKHCGVSIFEAIREPNYKIIYTLKTFGVKSSLRSEGNGVSLSFGVKSL